MGNTSIYIKDKALLKRARDLAGDDGFSAMMEKALTDFVERKLGENRGFTDHSFFVDTGISSDNRIIRFPGRLLASSVYGTGNPEEDAQALLFQTTAGNLVFVVVNDTSDEASDYSVYATLDDLRDGGDIAGVPDRERFLEEAEEAITDTTWPVEWID